MLKHAHLYTQWTCSDATKLEGMIHSTGQHSAWKVQKWGNEFPLAAAKHQTYPVIGKTDKRNG